MSRILSAIRAHPWAITQPWLETMVEIASRENLPVETIEKEMGRRLENTYRARLRGGVAVLPVTGPLFRRANLLSTVSGATSTELLATDFSEAVRDDQVKAIILEVDSPGGEVNGLQEMAEMVFRARASKPILTFVSGMGTSGAYWLGSQAEEVVVSETAVVGSVGAVLQVEDFRKAEEKAGIRTLLVVSSQSPRKRMDPFDDDENRAGRARTDLQVLVDDQAEVFLRTVARGRGVEVETVLSDYGQGGVFVGQAAVTAGMADRVGTLEDLIEELNSRGANTLLFGAAVGGPNTRGKEITMPEGQKASPAAEKPDITLAYLEEHHADMVASFRAEGRKQGAEEERARILGIQGIDARGLEELKIELMENPEVSQGDAALRILNAHNERQKAQSRAHLDGIKADEAALDAPTPASAPNGGEDETVATVAFIMNAGKPKGNPAS